MNHRRSFLLLAAALAALPASAHAQDQAPARPQPDQPVILVTGSTDGLGREVARRLAAGGAHVIVHGRSSERGEALVREIVAAGSGSARFYAADFGSLDEVRDFAARILADYDRLDVLVNNAGIWLARTPERQLSADGHELHFAVNYLAGYALTRLLLPRIVESAPARIVNVASGAQRPIDFDDVMMERGYSPMAGYAQSKLAQVLFTMDLAEELANAGVTVVALHPATLMNTSMVRESGIPARTPVAEGVEAVLQLVTSPDVKSGTYYDGLRPARAHAQASDAAARARLRALSNELTGLRP